MPYTKPGAEVTYVQTTVSPNLTTPSLPAVVIGKAYKIHDIAPNSSFQDEYSDTYSNSLGTTVTLSGIVTADNIDSNSVYVDLIARGNRLHLDATTDFTYSAGDVTISGSLGSDWDGAAVKIGYREQLMTLNELTTYEGFENIQDRIGKIDIFNQLAWGVNWAMVNAGLTVNGYGINSATETTGHTAAISDLALEEDAYTLAPMTNSASIHTLYQAHCVSMSNATNKKERILAAGKAIPWVNSSGVSVTGSDAATVDKTETMNTIADAAFSNLQSRTFWIYPDVDFVETTLHISQLKRTYLNAAFGGAYGTTSGEFAKLKSTITLTDGTKLFAGANITDAVWAQLIAESEASGNALYFFDALVPIPGYYNAAVVAGQRAGNQPEQPLTNLPITGPAQIKYGSDFFSETQLNIAAGAGTYWLWQRNKASSIVCRHQLSTDRSSIQTQEMSIRSQLDYTGKFLRNGVAFYIGRNTITPAFIKFLQTVVSAQGNFLVREGRLNGFKLISMAVDPNASDTILCTIEVLPKFPVNYIKFTLNF